MAKQKELVVEKLKKNGSSLEEMERSNLPLQDPTALCKRQVVPAQCPRSNTGRRFRWTTLSQPGLDRAGRDCGKVRIPSGQTKVK